MQLAEAPPAKWPARIQMERERRRLGQVRKSFAAVIEQIGAGAAAPLEFLCVCVDYIQASMDRLHAQDQRIHDLLVPTDLGKTEGADALTHLDARLAASRIALGELARGAETFRTGGGKDWAAFSATIAHFMDVYFNTLLKGQHSTLPMQDKLFGLPEWDAVAGVTNLSLTVEAGLFAALKRLAPPGADPDSMGGGRPAN